MKLNKFLNIETVVEKLTSHTYMEYLNSSVKDATTAYISREY
jgi:hypothetical protein